MSSAYPLPATAYTQSTIPLPQTPSKRSRGTFPVSDYVAGAAGHSSTDGRDDHPTISQPQTPTRRSTKSRNPSILPETPRKGKGNVNQRLRGIKPKTARQPLSWRNPLATHLNIEAFIYTKRSAGPLDTTDTPGIRQYFLCGHWHFVVWQSCDCNPIDSFVFQKLKFLRDMID